MAIVRAFVMCERAKRHTPGKWDLLGIFSSLKSFGLPIDFSGAIVGLFSDVREGMVFTLKLVNGSNLEVVDSHDHVAKGVFDDGKYEMLIQPTNIRITFFGKAVMQLWHAGEMIAQYDFDVLPKQQSQFE